MALDVGERRIGVSVSDALGYTAQSVETYVCTETERDKDVEYIAALAEKLGATRIVVGLPLHLNGSEGQQVEQTKQFAEALRERCGLELVYWDERMSSVAAKRVLIEGGVRRKNRKGAVDRIAASLFLQSYLDANTGRL